MNTQVIIIVVESVKLCSLGIIAERNASKVRRFTFGNDLEHFLSSRFLKSGEESDGSESPSLLLIFQHGLGLGGAAHLTLRQSRISVYRDVGKDGSLEEKEQ